MLNIKFNQKQNSTAGITILSLFVMVLIFHSCGKEEIRPHDIPLVELENSFFQFNEETVVVRVEDIQNDIISESDNSIQLSKSEMYDTLQVGGVLMTELYTPLEDQVFRYITKKTDMGDSWMFESQTATMEQAFLTYYYDSKKPDVISYRTSYQLSSLAPLLDGIKDGIATIINTLAAGYVDVGFELAVDGTVDITMVHPHVIFLQSEQNLTPLYQFAFEQAFNTLPDTDGDGVKDVVEEAFGTLPNLSTDYPRIRKMEINNFRFTNSEIQFKYGTNDDLTVERLNFFKPSDKAKEGLKEIPLSGTIASLTNGVPEFTYVPTGVNLPVGGIFGCYFPSLKLAVSAEVASKVSMVSNRSTKIEFGSYNLTQFTDFNFFNNYSSDVFLEPKFVFSDQSTGQVYSDGSDFIANTTTFGLDFVGTFTGSASVGVGFGLAFSVLEPNNAGISVGGYVLPYAYISGEGQLGMDVAGFLSSNQPPIQNILDNAYMQACLDFGVGCDGFAFVDTEDPTGIADELFDAEQQLFESKFSIAGYLAGSNYDKLCFPDGCDGVEVSKFDVNILSDELASFDINIGGGTGTCEVSILTPLSEEVFKATMVPYDSDQNYTITDSDKISKLKIYKDNLIINIKDEFQECTNVSNSYNYYGQCANADGWNTNTSPNHTNSYVPYNFELHENDLLEGYIFLRNLPNDRMHYYYNYNDARNMCQLLGGRLPTDAEASDFSRGDCFGPTGYIVPNDNIVNAILNSENSVSFVLDPDIVDEDRLVAIWTETSTGGAGNVGRIYARDKTTGFSQNVNVSATAESFFAPCLCVRD